jgi:hypothetical protein
LFLSSCFPRSLSSRAERRDSILANVLWCAKINRDKKNGKYSQYEGSGDDRDPAFKMVL